MQNFLKDKASTNKMNFITVVKLQLKIRSMARLKMKLSKEKFDTMVSK
jgi:hypothetical protein